MNADPAAALYPPELLARARDTTHEGPLPEATHHARCANPLCGDRVDLFLQLQGERIVQVKFQAKGCAIARASSALLAERLRGLSPTDALLLGEALVRTLNGAPEPLGSLAPLSGVAAHPARIGCATLPWQALARCLAPDPT